MLQDLDATIAALLTDKLSQVVAGVAITFATPDDQFPPSSVTLPAIDLFLYDVRENLALRTNEWGRTQRDDGMVMRHQPPPWLDCSYLITAWPGEGTGKPSEDEHRLLGEVTKILLRYRRIPPEYVQGELAGMDQPRTSILQPGHLSSMGEFWQALGGKPKAALHYTITVNVNLYEPTEVGLPVTSRVLAMDQIPPEP